MKLQRLKLRSPSLPPTVSTSRWPAGYCASPPLATASGDSAAPPFPRSPTGRGSARSPMVNWIEGAAGGIGRASNAGPARPDVVPYTGSVVEQNACYPCWGSGCEDARGR